MTQIKQEGSNQGQTYDVSQIRRPISERKLRANRANAKRSTGPRTEAGKAASRRNALKHGILSCAVNLPPMTTAPDLTSRMGSSTIVSDGRRKDSALKDIIRIWDKLARVVVFEKECSKRPDGLEHNARLICRYERMLTGQLHERIREWAGFEE